VAGLSHVDVASVGLSRPSLIYTLLVIFVGALTFIVRTRWVPLIVGFVVFENGIFLLALQLKTNLPLGIELGAFVDTLLVLVAAATLQIWSRTNSDAEAPH
jgi:hydrogenase-4 component E